MEKLQLLSALLICASAAAVFLCGVFLGRTQACSRLHIAVIPIDKETRNIELTARELLIDAEKRPERTFVIIIDDGADPEQLVILDKIVGERIEYVILKRIDA